jgi:hypothetical protein
MREPLADLEVAFEVGRRGAVVVSAIVLRPDVRCG